MHVFNSYAKLCVSMVTDSKHPSCYSLLSAPYNLKICMQGNITAGSDYKGSAVTVEINSSA